MGVYIIGKNIYICLSPFSIKWVKTRGGATASNAIINILSLGSGKIMKIGIVIVTFGDHKRLYRHLELLKDADAVYVINNGPGPVKIPDARYPVKVKNFDNIGPAGGFSEGAKLAMADGCGYVAFADDDAYPPPNLMERLRIQAGNGVRAAAGTYDDGMPVKLANHYLMVKTEVLREQGLYHEPFFLMFEDEEFYKRIEGSGGCMTGRW